MYHMCTSKATPPAVRPHLLVAPLPMVKHSNTRVSLRAIPIQTTTFGFVFLFARQDLTVLPRLTFDRVMPDVSLPSTWEVRLVDYNRVLEAPGTGFWQWCWKTCQETASQLWPEATEHGRQAVVRSNWGQRLTSLLTVVSNLLQLGTHWACSPDLLQVPK